MLHEPRKIVSRDWRRSADDRMGSCAAGRLSIRACSRWWSPLCSAMRCSQDLRALLRRPELGDISCISSVSRELAPAAPPAWQRARRGSSDRAHSARHPAAAGGDFDRVRGASLDPGASAAKAARSSSTSRPSRTCSSFPGSRAPTPGCRAHAVSSADQIQSWVVSGSQDAAAGRGRVGLLRAWRLGIGRRHSPSCCCCCFSFCATAMPCAAERAALIPLDEARKERLFRQSTA